MRRRKNVKNHTNRAVLILVTSLLAGCSIAREDMRGTYDYKRVTPGEKKEAIEQEIGSPDEIDSLENGNTRAIYSTSRVDESTKQSLIGTREGLDLFTAGAFELMDPFAISEDQSKVFTVFYGSDGVTLRVFVVCPHNTPQRTIEIPPSPQYGISCTSFLRG